MRIISPIMRYIRQLLMFIGSVPVFGVVVVFVVLFVVLGLFVCSVGLLLLVSVVVVVVWVFVFVLVLCVLVLVVVGSVVGSVTSVTSWLCPGWAVAMFMVLVLMTSSSVSMSIVFLFFVIFLHDPFSCYYFFLLK